MSLDWCLPGPLFEKSLSPKYFAFVILTMFIPFKKSLTIFHERPIIEAEVEYWVSTIEDRIVSVEVCVSVVQKQAAGLFMSSPI